MNRVTDRIKKMEDQIQQRIKEGKTTAEEVENAHKSLDMDLEEYCSLQNLKSLASTDGTLTLTEAQTVYDYLGESVETFNSQTVAVKFVLTNLHAELLARRIGMITA